ncbi:hypothetical protein D3C75_1366720 [compost metagenome]
MALLAQARVYCCRMKVARLFSSSLLNCAKGGIGMSPHLPLPPCWMLDVSLVRAWGSLAYLAATS